MHGTFAVMYGTFAEFSAVSVLPSTQLLLPLAYRARFGERTLLDTARSAAKARATVSQLSELHQYNSASPQPRSIWRFYALFDIALFEAKEVSCAKNEAKHS